ncbi:MAG: alanyl-tRNA editing protein [Euryarchaeota archaeon]|nr:alanyl-tRNA editing protein [Euryarchaeota archaeon]
MTLQLHMPDIDANYLKDFTAKVVKRGDDYLVLDRTAFYPTGGGQEHDVGELHHDDGAVRVRDVKKKGEVRHYIEGDVPDEVTKVTGLVDWERRYAHMRMHTAQHLVSALVYDLFGGARTVGNQIHRSRSRIDFSLDALSATDLVQIEEDANQVIASKRSIDCYTEARTRLMERVKPERSNLDLIPAHIEDLRVIEIKDFDICPCAGTHVRNTDEIGRLQVLGTRSKGKDKTRFEFTLEGLEPEA